MNCIKTLSAMRAGYRQYCFSIQSVLIWKKPSFVTPMKSSLPSYHAVLGKRRLIMCTATQDRLPKPSSAPATQSSCSIALVLTQLQLQLITGTSIPDKLWNFPARQQLSFPTSCRQLAQNVLALVRPHQPTGLCGKQLIQPFQLSKYGGSVLI